MLFLVAGSLGAQSQGVVRGTVRAAADDTAVEGVRVIALLSSPIVVTTGAAGRFELLLPPGTVRIVAAGIGFAPETLLVSRDSAHVQFHLARAPIALTPVAVSAERTYSAASSGTIRDLDVHLRPRESSQQLLGLVPGLVIAQHAGGGKAEQIFLRGFDADHGTDVAVTVDGTPANLVSHAHGQGYADLHFLIPEVVDHAEVRKGPYDVRDGDLATAGAVSFVTRDRVERAVAASRGGSFGTAHAIALVPVGGDATRAGGYLAASGHVTRGMFERSQDYRRGNVFGKWTTPLGDRSQLIYTASGFASRWDASGQIPERAVRSGVIGRFGAIDPVEGGHTSRFDASVAVRSVPGLADQWEARAYATRYELDLFSNFTFFLNDTTSGDGIEQRDNRSILGANVFYARAALLGGRPSRWSVGAGTRSDFTDVALDHQRQRTRIGSVRDAAVRQSSIYGWGSEEIDLSDRVRLQVGLRGDLFRFEVRDRLSPAGSGVRWHGIVSPKANLAMRVSTATTAFLNVAGGFHSNDARDVVGAGFGDRVLPRAVGVELGLRHAWHGGTVALAAWRLDLESELVYVGDEGVTEASGSTRRVGVSISRDACGSPRGCGPTRTSTSPAADSAERRPARIASHSPPPSRPWPGSPYAISAPSRAGCASGPSAPAPPSRMVQ
ncbi:MAG: TonB-dependent receptor [Gemmatimonadales bacterium]